MTVSARRWSSAAALAGVFAAGLAIATAPAQAAVPACPENTPSTAASRAVTCSYTGADQSFTVPAGATRVLFDVYGAIGGSYFHDRGFGGRARALLATTPGAVLRIVVGQSGYRGLFADCGHVNGPTYGGGGKSTGTGSSGCAGEAGGGGSFVFDGAQELVVAGGGGGTGNGSSSPGAGGGLAGGDAARAGAIAGFGGVTSGTGGTGGAGATGGGTGSVGTSGSRGQGGDGAPATSYAGAGGGGGGGFYGGGGGSGGCCGTDTVGDGGGGSGYIHSAARLDASYTPGTSCQSGSAPTDCMSTGVSGDNGAVYITFRTRKSTTDTAVSCTAVPEDGTSTCKATVTDTDTGIKATPTGDVSFSATGSGTFSSTTCTLVETSTGVAACSVTYAPTGPASPTVSVSYGGDVVHEASTGSSTLNVARRTTTTLSCPDMTYGEVKTCTATVADRNSGATGAATGTVVLTSDDTSASFTPANGRCTLGAGTTSGASCTVTFRPSKVGAPTVHATYQGDIQHATSTGADSPLVAKRATTTAVSCPTVADGGTTTCVATIDDASSAGTASLPTGTVTFDDGGAGGSFASETCTLAGSGARSSCSVGYSPARPGTPHIGAVYAGSTTHTGSSGGADATVLRTTATALHCPAVVLGSATTCTATVTDTSAQGPASVPTGDMTFSTSSGGTFGSGGTCHLVSGTSSATCSVPYTPAAGGTSHLQAAYGGDPSHAGSSGSDDVTVRRTTATSVTCPTVVDGATTTCTANVGDSSGGAGAQTPTGTVTFDDGGAGGSFAASTCTLSGGSCSVGYTPASAGTPHVTAAYGGSGAHTASAGGADVTVLRTTATTLDCPAVTHDATTTCTVTVTDTSARGPATAPSGHVAFTEGSGGTLGSGADCALAPAGAAKATCSVPYIPAGTGTRRVDASYAGDAGHDGSAGSADVRVRRFTTTTVSCLDAVENQWTTCTAKVVDSDPWGTAKDVEGSVRFDDGDAGGGFASTSATCIPGRDGTATCSVQYRPRDTNSHVLTGTYTGDVHAQSSGTTTVVAAADGDGDAVADASDNCPQSANTDQADQDGDGHGDVCDDDRDGDGVKNAVDDFPSDPTRSRRPSEPPVSAAASSRLPDAKVLATLRAMKWHRGKGILAAGLRFDQDVPAGRVEWRLQLTVWREPTARAAAIPRPVTLAVVRRTVTRAGVQQVRIRVRSAKARRLLRTRRGAKVIVRTAYTAADTHRVLAAGEMVPKGVVSGR